MICLQSFSLFLQYFVQYFHKDSDSKDRYLISGFFYILGSRTLFVGIGALLPYHIGIWVYFFGIVFSYFLPILLGHKMRQVPINFPHLIKRISLLVIITFGEMIMKVGEKFSLNHFSTQSLLYFVIVILLFLYYFGEFDHSIDQTLNTLGLTIIYSHYFIFYRHTDDHLCINPGRIRKYQPQLLGLLLIYSHSLLFHWHSPQ